MNKLHALVARVRSSTEVDTRSLAIYRILLGLWFLFSIRLETWLVDVPPTFFEPPFFSLANLFDRFPRREFFHLLNGSALLFAALFTIGWRTRIAAIGLLVAQVTYHSFHFSLGKIDHTIMLPAALYVMSFTACSEYWSVDGWLKRRKGLRPVERTDLALLGVFIAMGFFSAGFGKALVWLDFNTDTGGFLAWLNVEYYTSDRTLLLASWAVNMPWPRLWEIADITAVIFELGFFWALLKRQRWLFWVTLWCAFHLMNTLILNIAFMPNAIVVMAFVPWAKLTQGRRPWIAQLGLGSLLGGMLMVISSNTAIGRMISISLGLVGKEWGMIASATVWTGLMFIFIQKSLSSAVNKAKGAQVPVSQVS